MNISPHELAGLCRWLGNHPSALVRCSEGCVAMKTEQGKMLISPARSAVQHIRGVELIELHHAPLADLVKSELSWEVEGKKILLDSRIHPSDPLPSFEAFLLAYLLSFEGVNVVAHTQPGRINQILCSPRARQFSDRRITPEEVLACGPASVLVPHCDTLIELARETRRKIALWQDRFHGVPRVVLLTNNGLIALGESISDIQNVTEMAVRAAETFVGAAILGGPVFLTPGNVSKIELWK